MLRYIIVFLLLTSQLFGQISSYPAAGGAAATADALSANGANCSAGNYPLGVDEAGAVESCTAVSAALTNQFQPITRWIGPDLVGYIFPDISLNIFEAEQTQVTHDALFRWSPETTANAPVAAAGSRRMYVDSRIIVRSDFNSNISLKAWYSSEVASGNYRFNVYFADYADGDNLSLPEVLTDLSFASCADWAVAGDFTCAAGVLVYLHSTGAGTATMDASDFATTAIANMYYNFGYTTSAVASGGPSGGCTITTAFSLAAQALDVDSNQTDYVQFVSATSPGNFVISCTSSAADSITFDNVTLKPVFEQVVQLTDAVPATAHEVDVIEFTPGTALVAGQILRTRFEVDYVNTANTADGIGNLLEVGLEGDQ